MLNSEFGMYQNVGVETENGYHKPEMQNGDYKTGGAGCTMPVMDSYCPTGMGMDMGSSMSGVVCPPVYECPTERCVHRHIVHEVPHV